MRTPLPDTRDLLLLHLPLPTLLVKAMFFKAMCFKAMVYCPATAVTGLFEDQSVQGEIPMRWSLLEPLACNVKLYSNVGLGHPISNGVGGKEC